MGKQTGITWTDSTWNPWRGCRKVSAGCKNCYMFREQARYGKDPAEIVRAATGTFNAPLRWREPARVFTCSWSDFFIAEADAWRAEAWEIIRRTPHLSYQVLTKRPERIERCLPADWGAGWPNVWLGVTVESQDVIVRAQTLQEIPARVRFISYEPALGVLDLNALYLPNTRNEIHWLISGGESGPGCRAANWQWFDSIRWQCSSRNIAYYHKQNGGTKKINGVAGGDDLHGQTFHAFPA